MKPTPQRTGPRWLRILGLALGLVLLVGMIHRVGAAEIGRALLGIGWRFLLVLTVHAVVTAVSLEAWRVLLLGRPPGAAPPSDPPASILQLLRVKLVADAFNTLTPLASLGGEPYRVKVSAGWFGRGAALRSVILDRLCDQVAAVLLAVGGTLSAIGLGGSAGAGAGAAGAVGEGAPAEDAAGFALAARTAADDGFLRGKLRRLRDAVRHVRAWDRDRWLAVRRAFLWRLAGRGLSVVELAVIVACLGGGWHWRLALVAAAANVGVSAAFTWIPGAVGASEAGFAGVFAWAGMGWELGLTVGLVRRLRSLTFAGVGVAALALRRRTPDRG